MARSLNRVQLIGNLTRDPELRYTPAGTAVCSFSIATNRSWTTDAGEKKDEADFHRIVAWNKLAELCSQFLTKGKKVYVEGRLSTRNWTDKEGGQRSTTEVIISDMILLDSSGRPPREEVEEAGEAEEVKEEKSQSKISEPSTKKAAKAKKSVQPASQRGEQAQDETEKGEKSKEAEESTDEVAPDDIPF